jgi:hypothetical protein
VCPCFPALVWPPIPLPGGEEGAEGSTRLRIIGKRKQTHIVPASLNPVWRSLLTFAIPRKAAAVAVAEARTRMGAAADDCACRHLPLSFPPLRCAL